MFFKGTWFKAGELGGSTPTRGRNGHPAAQEEAAVSPKHFLQKHVFTSIVFGQALFLGAQILIDGGVFSVCQ
jgi:hypothetical protein